ncbi:MAG: [FeFe] hydrogenase H-cluster radical SAM maturase HydE [Lachnospiraceae bacterium]|nr:[FeFe] hydrogenase H-cluster radical SAM maturase HydE [Lachnospiraceae bacterium]MDD7378009.1 [FeFe] hydrogenase H-cluster radical SAM maturase HydE [Lachnospiraceae bacterium]MDY4616991.1 [FeFe] hydrogenase H-cluster radical SAM maturase HydE [Lachnospiraceae bacterium]
MNLLEKLEKERMLTKDQWIQLIGSREVYESQAAALAKRIREEHFGNQIYVRGLIEFTNYCKNDCYYCGIRRSNRNAERYRLTIEQILECTDTGYELGFRTFVLQGGEDGYYTDERLEEIIKAIKEKHPDCALTLSLGERSRKSYELFYQAGADRYLLRHETADAGHYQRIHPEEMSYEHRMNCLKELKAIGYQVGCGFMVGSPGQTEETLAEDMLFIQGFQPHMVGIGPFVPHHETPFGREPGGTVEDTLYLLSLIRILKPTVLLPATTALGTIDPRGREKGILAGANVVMPNLSPTNVRKKYELYDNKICTGDEAAECRSCLSNRMKTIGCELVTHRGDAPGWNR